MAEYKTDESIIDYNIYRKLPDGTPGGFLLTVSSAFSVDNALDKYVESPEYDFSFLPEAYHVRARTYIADFVVVVPVPIPGDKLKIGDQVTIVGNDYEDDNPFFIGGTGVILGYGEEFKINVGLEQELYRSLLQNCAIGEYPGYIYPFACFEESSLELLLEEK